MELKIVFDKAILGNRNTHVQPRGSWYIGSKPWGLNLKK